MKPIVTLSAVLFAFAAGAGHVVSGGSPALSPDGRSVAYQEFTGHGSGYQIIVRDLEHAGRMRVIESDIEETRVAWSPDSRTLAYVKVDDEGPPVLWRVHLGDAADERSQTVLPDASAPSGVAFLDDRRVLMGLGDSLVIAAPDGTVTTAVDLSENEFSVDLESISVSPRGRVAFSCGSQVEEQEAICVLDLEKPDAAPVKVTSGRDLTPLWRGEDELVFSRAGKSWSRGGLSMYRWHLWSQNLRTGETLQLTSGDVVDVGPTADRGGERLMSARIELAALERKPNPPEKRSSPESLEDAFETLVETIRQSTIVTVERP